MSLVWTIASTSARNICSDSLFRLIPCTSSTATKIERADLIWRLHTPPILPAVGGLPFQWIHCPPCSSINTLILCSLSLKMWFCTGPSKICTNTSSDDLSLPLLDTNLRSACMKTSVNSEFADST